MRNDYDDDIFEEDDRREETVGRRIKIFLGVALTLLLVAVVLVVIMLIKGGTPADRGDDPSNVTAGDRTDQTDNKPKPDSSDKPSALPQNPGDVEPDAPVPDNSNDPMRELEVRVSSVSETPKSFKVTASDGLYMRRGPDSSYEHFDRIDGGEIVQSFALVDNWRLVMYNGVYGWSSADYLEQISDTPTPPDDGETEDKPTEGGEHDQGGNGLVCEVIALNTYSITFSVSGETFTLEPTVYPEDGGVTPDMLSWYTSDPTVAIVEKGVVRSIGPGTCTIEVDFGGISAICEVEVKQVNDTPVI